MTMFDCCPNQPWPLLVYTISFERSQQYYATQLILPVILLTYLSFAPLCLSPNTGERLGFGITVILAMLAYDITASSLMPICNEKLFMQYIQMASLLFCFLALFETCVVLYVFHLKVDSIWESIILFKHARRWLRTSERVMSKKSRKLRSSMSMRQIKKSLTVRSSAQVATDNKSLEQQSRPSLTPHSRPSMKQQKATIYVFSNFYSNFWLVLETLRRSFSVVSTPNFASTYSFESS